MISKRSATFGKPLSLLLLSLSSMLLSQPMATKAQEKPLAPKPVSPEYLCPSQLGSAIDTVINRPQFRHSHWGILIESLSSGSKLPNRNLYSHNAQKYFIPASNVKLLTTAAALNRLGSQFRIRTSVLGTDMKVYVIGRGDPTLTDTQLRQLAQQLKRQGISQIQQLFVQNDYFKGPAINPSWEWEDVQADYGAQANSLILNQNATTLTLSPQAVGQPLKANWADPIAATQWRVENNTVTGEPVSQPSLQVTGDLGKPVLRIRGTLPVTTQPVSISLAVLDPAELFLRHFQRVLALEGITVGQASVSSNLQPPTQELATIESPPLATLLMETNQNSNNLYAEVLLRSLGAVQQSQDSVAMGLVAIKETLTKLGVDPQSYVLADGSGLSRHNLVSPAAFVQALRAVAQTPEAALFKASLPVAGKSGTLQNRFRNTPAEGILQAKTGTMSGVSSLSGYLAAPSYQPLVFSILVNQSEQPAATIRQAIDEIALLMTRLHRC